MKCPKCSYLGFETGDRCRNCGYDFSLVSKPDAPPGQADLSDIALAASETLAEAADLPLRLPQRVPQHEADRSPDVTMAEGVSGGPGPTALDGTTASPFEVSNTASPRMGSSRAGARAGAPPLPLFRTEATPDDEPLVKLPAAPRPPLAVRRTPDKPRPRSTPRPARRAAEPVRHAPGPALQFLDEPQHPPAAGAPPVPEPAAPPMAASGAARRLVAAVLDHGVLLAVDAIVIYFTLRMAGLDPGQWRLLPPVPLAAFLAMVKVAYFCAFTLVGGQTIGKMAMRIRVVGDDGAALDPARAIRRTLAGAISLLAAGLGFLPVLLTDDRRGVHDRVARTRVIALPSGRDAA